MVYPVDATDSLNMTYSAGHMTKVAALHDAHVG